MLGDGGGLLSLRVRRRHEGPKWFRDLRSSVLGHREFCQPEAGVPGPVCAESGHPGRDTSGSPYRDGDLRAPGPQKLPCMTGSELSPPEISGPSLVGCAAAGSIARRNLWRPWAGGLWETLKAGPCLWQASLLPIYQNGFWDTGYLGLNLPNGATL